jgi:hypothetical protein
LEREKQGQNDAEEQGKGQGRLHLNIGKMIFLVAVLVAFWYFFDKWLGSK